MSGQSRRAADSLDLDSPDDGNGNVDHNANDDDDDVRSPPVKKKAKVVVAWEDTDPKQIATLCVTAFTMECTGPFRHSSSSFLPSNVSSMNHLLALFYIVSEGSAPQLGGFVIGKLSLNKAMKIKYGTMKGGSMTATVEGVQFYDRGVHPKARYRRNDADFAAKECTDAVREAPALFIFYHSTLHRDQC